MLSISRRLKNVQNAIQFSAITSARRPESITLLAVSKSFSYEAVIEDKLIMFIISIAILIK